MYTFAESLHFCYPFLPGALIDLCLFYAHRFDIAGQVHIPLLLNPVLCMTLPTANAIPGSSFNAHHLLSPYTSARQLCPLHDIAYSCRQRSDLASMLIVC